jgi:hypothetical protein
MWSLPLFSDAYCLHWFNMHYVSFICKARFIFELSAHMSITIKRQMKLMMQKTMINNIKENNKYKTGWHHILYLLLSLMSACCRFVVTFDIYLFYICCFLWYLPVLYLLFHLWCDIKENNKYKTGRHQRKQQI